MAEELADGEFWLPSDFLTDTDIVSDFFGSETSDEEINSNINILKTINFLVPTTKAPVLLMPTSPQSTLFGYGYEQGSSYGSPSEKGGENGSAATLELLNEAAGEVAKMKMKSDKCAGTGFFDCSKAGNAVVAAAVGKRPVCPSLPPSKPLQKTAPPYQPPYYSHPQFRQFPGPAMWSPGHLSSQSSQVQNKAKKNNGSTPKNNGNNNNNCLGLPQSAWPPLSGQTKDQEKPLAKPKSSVGTGVFLPRQVSTQTVTQNKSDDNSKKSKNSKRSQRKNRPSKVNDDEIQLPSEWIY